MPRWRVDGKPKEPAVDGKPKEPGMKSTMQSYQLTITSLMTRGARLFPTSEVVTWQGDTARHSTYAEVYARAARLANVLRTMGVKEGDRVATLAWNNQEHMEAPAGASAAAVVAVAAAALSPS